MATRRRPDDPFDPSGSQAIDPGGIGYGVDPTGRQPIDPGGVGMPAPTPAPTAGMTQYDPGIWKDTGGSFWTYKGKDLVNAGKDPSVFHIGQPTPPGGWNAPPPPSPPPVATGGAPTTSAPAPTATPFFGASAPTPPASPFNTSLRDQLQKIFMSGGNFNQDIVNRRTELAREDIGRQAKMRAATNRAALADRGLLGSGPEVTAQDRMEQDIADRYGAAVSNIYANESAAADDRLMRSLQTAAGLSSEEARNLIDTYRAQTERGLGTRSGDIQEALGLGQLGLGHREADIGEQLGHRRADIEETLGLGQLGLGHRRTDIEQELGLGNLALGNLNAVNDFNLNLGRFGLDRDRLQYEIEHGNLDRVIQLLENQIRLANQTTQGHR